MFEKLFNSQLKRLYEIDKNILKLKAEKKELLEIIEHNNVERQGRYRLVKDGREARVVKVDEYRKIVSDEEFLKSAIVPVKSALKYVSEKELMKITYKKTDHAIYVVKE